MQKGITNVLNLCHVPTLDNQYNHTIDFENKDNQHSFFMNKRVTAVGGNYILDSERTSYLVEKTIDELKNVDYLFIDDFENDKTNYYFVDNIEYKTKTTCVLYVSLDVFQTYLFNFNLGYSFVDRCHVDRWYSDGTPCYEVEPEDLQLTHHNIYERRNIYDYQTKGTYIITSTEPLGVVNNRRNKGTGGEDNNNGNVGNGENVNWKNGYLSSKGFRFLKQNEGFGKWSYGDSAGNPTIAYGVSKHGVPTEYNQLLAQQPLSEEIGAKVSYEVSKKYFGDKIISKCIELGVTKQNEFDALIDLSYNCGYGVLFADNSLTRALKSKTNIQATWEKFYVSDGVSVQPGLVTRRKEEVQIFLNNTYTRKGIAIYNNKTQNIGQVTENNGDGWLPSDKVGSDDNKLDLTVQNVYGWGFKPTSGTISAYYPNYPSGSVHTGVDIANNEGTPIYAWRGGTVKAVASGYGLSVWITHDDGKSMAIYGHNSKYLVNVGDKVVTGQKIALMGSTGNSTGNHLHFEIRPVNGAYGSDVNPWWNIKLYQKV